MLHVKVRGLVLLLCLLFLFISLVLVLLQQIFYLPRSVVVVIESIYVISLSYLSFKSQWELKSKEFLKVKLQISGASPNEKFLIRIL